jgi:hypothetical protein
MKFKIKPISLLCCAFFLKNDNFQDAWPFYQLALLLMHIFANKGPQHIWTEMRVDEV